MALAVGLDLGSHAVRAARLRLGTPAELRAFGQVGLPRGAIEHGEVIDPGAVASALKRLWSEAGIKDRQVRVGLASLRTIVRQVEIPEMSDDELRGALEFQAGDFIPLPIEDTLLDYHVLERFETGEGESMMRVLIAAMHRDTLGTALTAVREAGLQAVAVDLIPFALVRSLAGPPVAAEPAPASEGDEGGEAAVERSAEVLVSVGSGITAVVVHERGAPRFVRIVDTGGDDLTEAIGTDLGLEFDDAELLKRSIPEGVDQADVARAAMDGALNGIVNEIRGSVDFYASQAEARSVARVLVTGGATLTENFVDRLADALDLPVEPADPLARLQVADIGFDAEQLALLRPYLAVPVGLAIGGEKGAAYPINLLPERERRAVAPSRLILIAGGALAIVAAGLAVITMQRNDELNDAKAELAEQQSTNQQLQAEITSLQGAQELQTQADEARGRVASVLATDVSWSRMLQEVARVIPQDVWLQSFNGTVTAGQAEGAPPGAISGSVSVSATGTDFPAIAAWLQRMAALPAFTDTWVSEASAGDATQGAVTIEAVTFSSTVELTDATRSERSRKAREEAGVDDGPGAPQQPAPEQPPAGGETP